MISLCSFIKNESHCIENMLNSVKDVVDEIVIVDTGSTDNTIEICGKYTDRIYQIGFTDFGKIRTLTAHLAKEDWVLMLDADETLSDAWKIRLLANQSNLDAFAFPRKRWLDLEMTKQTETEAYPDLQVRLFRNNTKYVWKRELHEYFDGAAVEHIEHSPCIHHFQDFYKDEKRRITRDNLYSKLAEQAGVSLIGGKPIG